MSKDEKKEKKAKAKVENLSKNQAEDKAKQNAKSEKDCVDLIVAEAHKIADGKTQNIQLLMAYARAHKKYLPKK